MTQSDDRDKAVRAPEFRSVASVDTVDRPQSAASWQDTNTYEFNPNHRVEDGNVRFTDVIVDLSVQRERVDSEVNAIAGDFNPHALGTVTVSVRSDGAKVLLDGQQRLTAATMADYNEPVRAILHYGLTREEEAVLFRQLNFRRSVGPVALFNAAVTEGNRRAVAIKRLLDEYGIEVKPGSGLGAIKTVQRIAEWPNGVASLRWAIDMMITTWGSSEHSASYNKILDGRIMEGLAMLHARNNGADIDTQALRRKLAELRNGIHEIIGRARSIHSIRGGRMPVNVADVLVGIHNNGIRKEENKIAEFR